MNGPSARIPCEAATVSPPDFDDPDPSYASRVLEGYELDEFVREHGLYWRDFAGATPVVTATPPPSPARVPSPRPPTPPSRPPPPPRPNWNQEDFIPVPPLSPPPDIPSRKRRRGSEEIRTGRERRAAPRAQSPPRRPSPPPGRRPRSPSPRRNPRGPTIRIPAGNRPRSKWPPAPRLVVDSRATPTTFVHEAHRPIGAVVRQLLPRCPHCEPGRFCSDDTDPNAKRPNKPRRTCYHCNKLHEKCQTWSDFQEAFNERMEEVLWDFRFEFWEHLGEGRYQLLLPDPRSMDLVHLGESSCTPFSSCLIFFFV